MKHTYKPLDISKTYLITGAAGFIGYSLARSLLEQGCVGAGDACAMITRELQLVLQAGVLSGGGEVFVLDMGEPVRIVDLATDLIEFSRLKPYEDIEIRFTGLRPGDPFHTIPISFRNGRSGARRNHNENVQG